MRYFIPLAALALAVTAAVAQDAKPADAYKVQYTFREGATNAPARRFSLVLESNGRGSFRLGHKTPYATSSSGTGTTQWNYLDAGVNIDCRLAVRNPGAGLHTEIEISSVVLPDKNATPPPAPTVAQMRINLDSAITIGKPTVIATIDDPAASRKFDVEVLVSKID